MKNYIQVNNFRKYISTPEIELCDLNFFVGTNSSGKSSIVKAYLLITNFIKSDNLFEIDFSSSEYRDLNIQDFNRQICKYSNSEDNIFIELGLNDFIFKLELIPHDKSNHALVLSYHVTDLYNDIVYEYDYKEGNIYFDVDIDSYGNLIDFTRPYEDVFNIRFINNIKYKDQIILVIKHLINRESDPLVLEKLNIDLKFIENIDNFPDVIKDNYQSSVFSSFVDRVNYCLSTNGYNKRFSENYTACFDNIIFYYRTLDVNKEGTSPDSMSIYRVTGDYPQDYLMLKGGMKMSTKKKILVDIVKSLNTIFLPINFKKYTNLNSIVDKSNDLAELVHVFYNSNLYLNKEVREFIKFWLDKDQFNIGDDFEINFYGGEAYEVLIQENGVKIPLVDKGTGNIQIFKILLLIANQFKKNKLIILEEPELNLHPSMQSKMADLFAYINEEHHFKMIVETHSEYLIRRLQVLSIQNKLDRDNLSITYFPTEINQDPYQLKIKEDGSLDKNFGSGFLDEAGNHMLELMRFNITSKN